MTTSSMNLTLSKVKEQYFPVASIEDLPDEIIQKIVTDNLNMQDAASFGRTNKRMYSIVEDKDTWKALYARIIRVNIFKNSDHPIDWKNRVHLAYKIEDVFSELLKINEEKREMERVHKLKIFWIRNDDSCQYYINNRSFFERLRSAFNWSISGISSNLSVEKELLNIVYDSIVAKCLELKKKRGLEIKTENILSSNEDFSRIDFSNPETQFLLIKKACKSVENYYKLPILDIGERMGDTGYIDFIEPSDMSEPVMRGEDRFNRQFIAIRIHKKEEEGRSNPLVLTFFQRYAGGTKWVPAGNGLSFFSWDHPFRNILVESGYSSPNAFIELRKLLNEGRLEMRDMVIELV